MVHLYTASGAIMALLGMIAVDRKDARVAFLWMFAATVVDSTDGLLARRAQVRLRVAWIDGAKLDDIVDYLTFVFLPAYLVYQFEMVPGSASLPVASAMLLSSAFGFSAADAKTDDHFFTGFPSYWNIVVFYLYALHTGQLVNVVVLAALAALVFVRVGYVYPSRTPDWRAVTLTLGAAWAAAVAVCTWMLPAPPRALLIGSLVFPVYYVVLSLVLQRARR
jgi:phosphatidylcholine synthase